MQDRDGDFPDELVEAFASGTAIVFVGAGASIGAGLPSWANLITPLRSKILGCPEDSSVTDVAQFFEDLFGRALLLSEVRRRLFVRQSRPTMVHAALLDLPTNIYFTTNFDNLLEREAENRGLTPSTIIESSDFAIGGRSNPTILKTHGDINRPETITITTSDYDHFAEDKWVLSQRLQSELLLHTALFIGYSFNDPDLRLILSRNARELKQYRRNVYSVQLSPSALAVRALERLGVKVIAIEDRGPSNRDASVAAWIRQLAARAGAETGSAAERQAEALGRGLPPRVPEFSGRASERAQLLEALTGPAPVVVLEGVTGVGKTSLSLEVVHSSMSGGGRSPAFEKVVWLSAKDYPQCRVYPTDLIVAVERETGVLIQGEDKARLKVGLSVMLQATKILIVLDGITKALSPELVSWLPEIGGRSKVLVVTDDEDIKIGLKCVALGGMEISDALAVLDQVCERWQLSRTSRLTQEERVRLVSAADYMPLKIRILSCLLNVDQNGEVLRRFLYGASGQRFEIAEYAYERLSANAKGVMNAFPFFAGVTVPDDALRAAAGYMPAGLYEDGLADCVRLGLVEVASGATAEKGSSYVVHSTIRSIASSHMDHDESMQVQQRMAEFYLDFVQKCVIRRKPKIAYWNALVTSGMQRVDEEWPNIRAAVEWSASQEKSDLYIDYIMSLVHYLDSRMLNELRISYVRFAAEVLKLRGRRHDEALIRIDALGWTLLEEGRLDEAETEIRIGLDLIDQASVEGRDLFALGHAWLARIQLQKGLLEDAGTEIQLSQDVQCSPWIDVRVKMAAGDVALGKGLAETALELFEEAAAIPEQTYGNEGHGYQILPRIGVAQIAAGRLDDANRTFRALTRLKAIPLSELYATYR